MANQRFICQNSSCGKEFEVSPAHVKQRGIPRYCSLKCYHEARTGKPRGPYKNARVEVECALPGCEVRFKPEQRSRGSQRFHSRACWDEAVRLGIEHGGGWAGGRITAVGGYIKKRALGHPAAVNGYVFEHRLVMEEKLGRYLEPGETVHHLNGIRDDNRPENLELWGKPQPKGIRASDQLPHCPTCTC